MTFEQYIINKYPLYAKVDFESINVSWGEVFKSYNEYLSKHQPIVTVEMHEPESIKPIWMVDTEEQNNRHRVHDNTNYVVINKETDNYDQNMFASKYQRNDDYDKPMGLNFDKD